MNRAVHMAVIGLDIAVMLFIAAAGYHSFHKPGLSDADVAFLPMRIDSVDVATLDDAELAMSRYAIGDSVLLRYTDLAGQTVSRRSAAIGYESTPVALFKLLLATAVFLLGAAVYFFRSSGADAALFHFASGALAVAIAGTKTIYALPPAWLGGLLCGIFLCSYGLLAVLSLHFMLHFPRAKGPRLVRFLPLAYAAAAALSLWATLSYLRDARDHAAARFDAAIWPTAILNGFVAALLAVAVGSFIHSYATARDPSDRKRLRWVLFGLCVGPTPFIFLSALPQSFGQPAMIPESVMLSFLFVVPVTFAIAIVRHRVLNIDLIINRSIVYGISLGGLVVLATLFFGVLANMVDAYARTSSPFLFIVVAVVFAMLFQPVKTRVQELVDRRFYRVRYNYRETQRKLFDEIRRTYDPRGLAGLVIGEVQKVLPVERIGFFTCDRDTHRLRLVAHENFAILEARGVSLHVDELTSALVRPVALASAVEPGLDVEPASEQVFGRWGIAVVLACVAEDGGFLGFLVLGRKKSGFRFLAEDVDLLAGIAAQTGLALERIAMQERLILEHAETERLEKLNQLKSYFVSSVTHDLKTPLTSIKMFAELLRTNEALPEGERREFLEIIEGESDRLTRMINGVLDFSMVERGVKSYRPALTEINREVESVLRSVQYQLTMERFTLVRRLAPEPCPVRVDPDAFAEAVWNLLSNAMKYSMRERRITVSTFPRDRWAAVRVEDRGAGIPEDKLGKIFEQFYRVDDGRLQEVSGTGLGLAIVKHIVDGHGGKIEVESAVGEGSAFTLLFPREL